MKKKKIKLLLIVNIVCCLFMLMGCNKHSGKETTDLEIKLEQGSIVKEDNNTYSNFVLDNGKYAKSGKDKAIFYYNADSGNYMYVENGKNMIHTQGEEIEITDGNVIDIKMSKKGSYISFFDISDYYKLKIVKLDGNEEININSNVAISGDYLDWLDDESLVYYGVDDKKKNGIFTYNLNEDKEKCIYQLHKGYIEYLEVTSEGIVFLENEGNTKTLKLINKDGQVEELSKDILVVKDVEATKKGIFVLGSMKKNNFSLYKIENGSAKRVIYDFPSIVDTEDGISATDSGDILFLGSEESNGKNNVYIYQDEYIKAVTDEESKYYFVNFN